MRNLLIPSLVFDEISLVAEHAEWLKGWLDSVGEEIEKQQVSASVCMAGVVAEKWLSRRDKTNWLGIMEEYLEYDGKPISYSESYGKKLYKFKQWRQHTVHAIYSRWWVEKVLGRSYSSAADYIASLVQPSGWIYNPDVSSTSIRTRMRSELFISLAMGIEILSAENRLDPFRHKLTAAAVSIPQTGYVSAEYFRFRALQALGRTKQMATGVEEMLGRCKTELGFADFSIADKVDDYMGSAKRVGRDEAVFSPLSTLYAVELENMMGLGAEPARTVREEVKKHLSRRPLGIPALHMRDLEPPFGSGETVYEVIAAAILLHVL